MLDQIETPQTIEALREEIVRRHSGLSKRLQQIARHILDEPQDLAFETLAVIGQRCGVQPSAIVRFAKSFGFEGASQMQKLFRDELLNSRSNLAYSDRVRQLAAEGDPIPASSRALLQEFAEGSQITLGHLKDSIDQSDIDAAVAAIETAESVHIVGFRRSFPVASYLAYLLLQAGKRTHLIDGVAGLTGPQVAAFGSKDILIAISYHPYADETVRVTNAAAKRGVYVIGITDSPVSPIAKAAGLKLIVREADVRGFRSLVTSMCLAQTVAITYTIRAAGRAIPRLPAS